MSNPEEVLKTLATQFFPLYSTVDLAERWGISRQHVYNKISYEKNFPQQVTGVLAREGKNKRGDGKLYPRYEVLRYEKEMGIKVKEKKVTLSDTLVDGMKNAGVGT